MKRTRGGHVVTYEYTCDGCGRFGVRAPMGSAVQVTDCPTCGRAARRAWAAPLVRQVPSPLSRAIARGEASADAPAVVDRVPPRRAAPARPTHPALARLPRP